MSATDITLFVLAVVVLATTIVQFWYTRKATRVMQSKIPTATKIMEARLDLQKMQRCSEEEAQQQCAKAIFVPVAQWIAWEAGEEEMLPELWDLFILRKAELMKRDAEEESVVVSSQD